MFKFFRWLDWPPLGQYLSPSHALGASLNKVYDGCPLWGNVAFMVRYRDTAGAWQLAPMKVPAELEV